MSVQSRNLLIKIRIWIVLFIAGLVLSGITAFPLQWEINYLAGLLGASPTDSIHNTTGILQWVLWVREGINVSGQKYPFMAYGTDWLAFAHLVIAIAFIGVYRDPVRNIWIIEWGMIACIGVIPLALICGPIRHIPFYHRLIDCSFGVAGIVPLLICRKYTLRLAQLENSQSK